MLRADCLIENEDFSQMELSLHSYYNCQFLNCDFSETNLTRTEFEDCTFQDCNFSNARVNQTKLENCIFKECKLLGVNFYLVSLFAFEISFETCVINSCNFGSLKMKGTQIVNSKITDCFFQETELIEASFEGSVFLRTLFHQSDLRKASFCQATGYEIDPTVNKIQKAKFSAPDVLNLLDGFDIIVQ